MVKLVKQRLNSVEFNLDDDLLTPDFEKILTHLASICAKYPKVDVLLDASRRGQYTCNLIIEEYDLFKKYRNSLNRIAVASDAKFYSFITDLFHPFFATDFRYFFHNQVKEAREWIFRSEEVPRWR